MLYSPVKCARTAASSKIKHSDPSCSMGNCGVWIALNIDIVGALADLHNSYSESDAKTMQRVHANKQCYQW